MTMEDKVKMLLKDIRCENQFSQQEELVARTTQKLWQSVAKLLYSLEQSVNEDLLLF